MELRRRERAKTEPLAGWTLDQFAARYAEDFDGFCALLDVTDKSGSLIPYTPNEIQRRFNAARTGRDNVLKPRQIGFTTLEQFRDAWWLLCRRNVRVVTVCQSIADQGPLLELSRRYESIFESLRGKGLVLQFAVEKTSEWMIGGSSLRVIQAGASETSASKKGRAGTVHRLHITETAFYEFADETLNALLECVPARETGSEIVNESTANGAAGWYYEHYKAAAEQRSGWRSHFYAWFEQSEYRTPLAPGEVVEPMADDTREAKRERELVEKFDVTPEQLKWFRQKVVDKKLDKVDQEYPTDPERCFLVSGRQYFEPTDVERLFAQLEKPLRIEEHGTLRVYAEPREGGLYLVVVDPAEGVAGDPTAIGVWDVDRRTHVAVQSGQFKTHETGEFSVALAKRYNDAEIVVERNNHGHAVLVTIVRELDYSNVFRDKDDRHGWLNTEATRTAALGALDSALHKGEFTTPDQTTAGEFRTFIVLPNGRAEAQRGTHDDHVLMSAIGWNVISLGRYRKRPAKARAAGLTLYDLDLAPGINVDNSLNY